jgi:exopolysaccharide production protein ExoZ
VTTADIRGAHLVHIQYLRGIAAMMVVLHHAVAERAGFFAPLAHSDFGRPGVLIFFVISGFVMMHACRDEPPGLFLARRVIRVVPLYWLMTLIFFAILFPNDLAAGDPDRRVPHLAASLLFVPHHHLSITDRIWPVLVPGWTLNFEMFFFALFGLGLWWGHVGRVVPAILLGLVATGLVATTQDPRLLTWTSPLLLLFLAGMGLAGLWRRFSFAPLAPLLPLGLASMLTAALGGLPAPATEPAFNLSAIMVVAGTLALQARRPEARLRLLGLLGDASYSIYLSHTILLIFILKALRPLPLSGWTQFAVAIPVILVLCALGGIACHRRIERPMLRALRRRAEGGVALSPRTPAG